ncbi:MAG: type IV secretory system conjugative DNA transfer family protein [Bacteroidetes bacterium]|nr:type IV secretory system conjugative DNA transfer family protein [Bacteroidota bacterium]
MILTIGAILLIIFLISRGSNTNGDEHFDSINSITSIFNKGFSLTGGFKAITREYSYRNALIIGPSGSGKTSTILYGTLNALVRGHNSFVILDISGEIYQQFSKYLSQKAKIYKIDFSDTSDGFNLIEAYGNAISSIQKLASILIKNSGITGSGDPYWAASSEKIIVVMIQLLWYEEPQYRTMLNLVRMLEVFAGEPKKIDMRVVKTKNEDLIAMYKALIATPDKTLQSSLSTALVALKIFRNPQVARVTAQSTFDFKTFRQEKSILFINIPVMDAQFMAPVTAVLFEQLFNVILERIPEKSEASIFAILDEMATLKFQNLGMVYANIRKYGGGCLGIVQDLEMLRMAWSPAEVQAIISNSYSKVFLPGQAHGTCKLLEDMLGKSEGKPLMTAAEIRTIKEALIFVGNHKPMKEALIPFYDHWQLKSRAAEGAYLQEQKIPFDTTPLLPF